MEHKPQTKQRSKYRNLADDDPVLVREISDALIHAGARYVMCYHRNVTDGYLRVIVDDEPLGWHLSISHAKRKKGGELGPGRYPKWDEIAHARFEFLPMELDFVMHLPPPEEYVALHDTTFHLHEYPDRDQVARVVTDGKTPLLERPSGLVVPGVNRAGLLELCRRRFERDLELCAPDVTTWLPDPYLDSCNDIPGRDRPDEVR